MTNSPRKITHLIFVEPNLEEAPRVVFEGEGRELTRKGYK